MATAVSTAGKHELFTYGWTTRVAWAKLYTNLDVLVDTQAVTLTYNAGVMTPSADIVFSVASGTNDCSYVEIGYTSGGSVEIVLYTKDLPQLYDFATAGTLTIDSWEISVGGTGLQTTGRDELCTEGWTSNITWVKLYTSGDVLLDTQNATFASNAGTGIMSPSGVITFNVAGSQTAAYAMIGYTDGTDKGLFKKIFSSPYAFATAGTLKVNSWEITI